MSSESDIVAEAALDWVIRVDRDDFADWDALAAWLAADPRHASTYAVMQVRVLDSTNGLADAPQPIVADAVNSNENTGSPHGVFRRLFLPLAASLIITSGLAAFLHRQGRQDLSGLPQAVSLATRAGETRAVTLADGTEMNLAGDTQLLLADHGRLVTIEKGRALFSVVHDARHPFVVRVGDNRVTDLGTRFDIALRKGGFDLAVSDGKVRVIDQQTTLIVDAGEGARVRAGKVSRVAVNSVQVDGWLAGRYSYRDATIGEIADDITSATGTKVTAAPDVGEDHFAGTLRFDKSAATTIRSVAPALGLEARRDGTGWRLESAADAPRP